MIPFASQNNRCGCDETTGSDDCCKTELKSIQLNADQLAFRSDQPSFLQADVNALLIAAEEKLYSSPAVHAILPASSPPASIPSYILQRSLLI
jgi:hypothetical protein